MRDNNEGGSPAGGPLRDPAARKTVVASDADVTAQNNQTSDDEASPRPVSADMQQFIGRQLRAVFDDVAKQPVPDRFLELMKQLDNKTATR
jgi:hypothetical protein